MTRLLRSWLLLSCAMKMSSVTRICSIESTGIEGDYCTLASPEYGTGEGSLAKKDNCDYAHNLAWPRRVVTCYSGA